MLNAVTALPARVPATRLGYLASIVLSPPAPQRQKQPRFDSAHQKASVRQKWISQRLANGFVAILLNIQIPVCCRERLALPSQQVRLSAAQPSEKQLLSGGSQLRKKHPRLHRRASNATTIQRIRAARSQSTRSRRYYSIFALRGPSAAVNSAPPWSLSVLHHLVEMSL